MEDEPKPRRRRFRWGVLLLVLLLVLPVMGLVVAAKFLTGNRSVTLMFPEQHEQRMARLDSPENAMLFLADAIKALPEKPGGGDAPAYATTEWRAALHAHAENVPPIDHGEPDYSRPTETALEELCWISAEVDDQSLHDYVMGTHAAWELVKTSFTKQFSLTDEPPRFQSQTFDEKLMQLGRNLVALGVMQFKEQPSAESLAPLLDAIRMSRMITRENDLLHVAQAIELPALKQLRAAAQLYEDPMLIAQALNPVGIGYLPRANVMQMLWQETDDLLGNRPDPPSITSDYGMFRALYFTEVQRVILVMKERQQEMLDVANQAPPRMRDWVVNNLGESDASQVGRRIRWGLRRAGEMSSDYAGTLLTLVVEAYYRDKGDYPPNLEPPLEGYLASPMGDPYTLQTFGYKKKERGYTLYSFGENLIDDGGSPDRDRIIEDFSRSEDSNPSAAGAVP